MGDENHMVGVDCAERGQAIAHDREKSDKNIVNYVDQVTLSAIHVNPAYCSLALSRVARSWEMTYR